MEEKAKQEKSDKLPMVYIIIIKNAGYWRHIKRETVTYQLVQRYIQSISNFFQLPKVNVKILDTESGKECGFNEIGELCFSAPNTMIGYFKNESATKEIEFIDEKGKKYLHTGDFGYIDKDRFVFFNSRLKRIYLTKSVDNVVLKLFPKQIEGVFESKSFVHLCGVVVKPDVKRLNVSVAFIELKSEEQNPVAILTELAIRSFPNIVFLREFTFSKQCL